MMWKGRKILLAGYYPPPPGGESIHVKDLAHRLSVEGVPVQVINLRRGAPPSAAYRTISGPMDFFRVLLKCLGSDTLLHLHTNGHSGKSWFVIVAAAIALRVRQAVGVLTLHSGLCPRYLARGQILIPRLVRMAASSFTHIVCVNEEIRRALEDLGAGRERLSVIPAFLCVEDVPSLSEYDAEMVSHMKPLIVAIGGAQPEYGLPLLMAALPALSRGLPSLGCIIIGSSWDDLFQVSVTDTGLAERVVCLGQISHDRCLSVLSCADIFVRPSYADGDSVAVREALALGIPVVASDTGLRPVGVTLFRRGDRADFIEKINDVLRNGKSAKVLVQDRESNSLERLLEVYQQVNGVVVSTGGAP